MVVAVGALIERTLNAARTACISSMVSNQVLRFKATISAQLIDQLRLVRLPNSAICCPESIGAIRRRRGVRRRSGDGFALQLPANMILSLRDIAI
jgi:hypothetical protein